MGWGGMVGVGVPRAQAVLEGLNRGCRAPRAEPGVPPLCPQRSPAPSATAAPKPGTPQEVQQLPPVQHVFPTPVSYVEGGDGSYPPGAIRSGSFPFAETPLFGQNSGGYFEGAGGAAVQPSPPPPPPPASSQAPPAST
ncbi:MHC class II regulatory factor RFX1-like, partial [Catharus ustulatus]|uniref:MHC class II regulatory factor RFX1-like n=1 Tax=Catharus ustulatus TaxID=91951 RepID=UPI00140E8299